MKEFSCGDVVPGCKAHFSFSTTEEILQAVAEHAQRDHGLTDISDALVEQVIANIKVAA